MTIRRLSSAFHVVVVLMAVALLGAAPADGRTYTVRKGDNFHDIAKKHKIPVEELTAANQISARGLKPGMKISIPDRAAASGGKNQKQAKTAPKATGTKTASDAPKPVLPADPGAQTWHIVRKGETLAGIARSYSLSPDEIKQMNSLTSDRLRAGQRLAVARADGPTVYTVKRGENLWQIARRFNTTAEDLMEINEMETPDIKAGQKLQLEVWFDADQQAPETRVKAAKNIEEDLRTLSSSEEFRQLGLQDRVIAFAQKFLNIPYKFGGNGIFGIDCSAYVKKVYGLLGMELPRTAREQFNEGQEISREDLSVGDLVFFRTYASFPSHVGIYLGNNLFIHASSKGKKVTVDNLDAPYYLKRFIGGKRLLTDASAKSDIDG
ncbi:MAG: C40 family peptidase [Thermodesulfovibrionales bacterium]